MLSVRAKSLEFQLIFYEKPKKKTSQVSNELLINAKGTFAQHLILYIIQLQKSVLKSNSYMTQYFTGRNYLHKISTRR